MKERFLTYYIWIFSFCFLGNCSGYHFTTKHNPLIAYGIKSLAVPMFINRSVLPQVAGPLTKEIILALNEYSGLNIISGDDEKADAVLIGIIDSKDYYKEVVKSSLTFTQGDIAKSIGQRSSFYYPSQTSYNFSLRVIFIKRPTAKELEFITSNQIEGVKKIHPKIVLEDTLDLSGSFARVVAPVSSTDRGHEVNFVKNRGIFDKSLQDVSFQAAQTFKQVILNAF